MSEQRLGVVEADLSALVARKGLGALRATYLPYRRPPWSQRPASYKARRLFSAAVILLIVVVLSVNAPGFGVALIILLAAMVAISIPRNRRVEARMRVRELRLYEHGLINVRAGQAGLAAIRWDEASVLQNVTHHYRNGTHTHTTYLYTLTSPDGAQAVISGIKGGIGGLERPDEWGEAIQRAVTSVQLPRAAAALERGETLRFADISVGRQGISIQDKILTWDQIQEIRVKDGRVSLKAAGMWRPLSTLAVKGIPNYFVFYALVERMHTATQPGR